MTEKVCTACLFCKHQDVGYSNYTVTGTVYDCLFGWMSANDDMPDEDQQKENAKAETCVAYKEGTGIYIDCDGEEEQASVVEWIKLYVAA